MPDLEPITREEMLWSGEDIEPITREEMYIKHIFDKTQTIPSKPITRKEMLLEKAGEGGGSDVTIKQLSVTANGTYSEENTAYSPVIVNVPTPPIPDNAYLLKEVEDVPADIVTFDDGEALPMPSLKVGIEPIQSGSGDPSPSNVRPISGWTEANVARCGKNLWGGEKLADDIVAKVPQATKDTTNKTVTYFASQVTGKTFFDRFKANTQYTIYLSTTSTYTNALIRYSDGTIDGIEPNTYKVTYANKTVSEIRGSWASGTTVLKYEECGIFEGVITAEDFVAYNGQTYTIPFTDAQGNPIEVFGGECDVVNGTVKPNIEYDSYNGETLVGRWISDRDVYAEGTTPTIGAQVVDLGAYGSDISVQPTSIKSIEGVNNVWADTGDIEELEYFSKEV